MGGGVIWSPRWLGGVEVAVSASGQVLARVFKSMSPVRPWVGQSTDGAMRVTADSMARAKAAMEVGLSAKGVG